MNTYFLLIITPNYDCATVDTFETLDELKAHLAAAPDYMSEDIEIYEVVRSLDVDSVRGK